MGGGRWVVSATLCVSVLGWGAHAHGDDTTTTDTTAESTTTESSTTSTTAVPADAGSPAVRNSTVIQLTPTLPPPPTTQPPPPPPPPTYDNPELPAGSGNGRRVVFSMGRMRVWLVDGNNQVVRTYRVSGHKYRSQPKAGSYKVFSRSRWTCNIDQPHICMENMVRFTKGPGGDNIGFHAIPVNTNSGWPLQSESQLGQALSSGCIRQANADAAAMWNFAPNGTTVVVVP